MTTPDPRRAAANAFGVIVRRAKRRVRYITSSPSKGEEARQIYTDILVKVRRDLACAETVLAAALWNTSDRVLAEASLLPIHHEVLRYLSGNPELAYELIRYMRGERDG